MTDNEMLHGEYSVVVCGECKQPAGKYKGKCICMNGFCEMCGILMEIPDDLSDYTLVNDFYFATHDEKQNQWNVFIDDGKKWLATFASEEDAEIFIIAHAKRGHQK